MVAANRNQQNIDKVAVIVVTYNSEKDIVQCLETVLAQNYPNFEVIIVDNTSTDSTIDKINKFANRFGNIIVINNSVNSGYAGAVNIGAKHTNARYIAILNPDVKVFPSWLSKSIEVIKKHGPSLVTPKILLMRKPGLINTCGLTVHYTGLSFCRGLGKSADLFNRDEEVGAVSGAAFVIPRDLFNKLGGFDAAFFDTKEDVDLSIRAKILGCKVLYTPSTMIHHNYNLDKDVISHNYSLSTTKFFFHERNRHLILLKIYDVNTLLLLAPPLLLTEVIAFLYSLLLGRKYIKSKMLALGWVLTHLRDIRRRRNEYRRFSQSMVLMLFPPTLPFDMIVASKELAKALDIVLNRIYSGFYWLTLKALT